MYAQNDKRYVAFRDEGKSDGRYRSADSFAKAEWKSSSTCLRPIR